MALPTFDVDIKCWRSFFRRFLVTVHDDDEYSPAMKFIYLRSHLSVRDRAVYFNDRCLKLY